MWTETPEGQELVSAISQDVVAQVAPEEMDLFDELMADYYAGPTPEEDDGDDPLAFGLEGMLAASTPAIAAMVTAVVTYIAQEVIKSAQEESVRLLTARIRLFFRPREVADRLAPDHIRQIYEIARDEATAAGMPADDADHMAHALVGKLALAS